MVFPTFCPSHTAVATHRSRSHLASTFTSQVLFFFLSFISLLLFHACFIHLLFSSHHVVQSEDPDTYHHLYTIVRSTRTAASAVTVMYDAVHVHDTLAIFSRSDYNTVQFSNVNKTNSCMLTSYKMKICNFCHQNNTSVCHACLTFAESEYLISVYNTCSCVSRVPFIFGIAKSRPLDSQYLINTFLPWPYVIPSPHMREKNPSACCSDHERGCAYGRRFCGHTANKRPADIIPYSDSYDDTTATARAAPA